MTTALLIQSILEEKKAEHIKLLKMGSSSIHDQMIVCETQNPRHVQALKDYVLEGLKAHQIDVHHIEGKKDSHWCLIDVYDVCCHIFLEEARAYYQLDELWADKVIG